MGQVHAGRDTKQYRERYPGKRDDASKTKNIRFYRNEIKSRPSGAFIETIHKPVELGGWFGDYQLLERHHGYIQWLFPIRETGMNSQSQQLQLHEAAAIASDAVLRRRLRKSYALMLDFYGMRLVDKHTGEIARAENYRNRFRHLNNSFHNYLRITRILKCLGECGFEHYKWPFLRFVLHEIFETEKLDRCKISCLNFWSQVLRKKKDQAAMRALVFKYQATDEEIADEDGESQSSESDRKNRLLDDQEEKEKEEQDDEKKKKNNNNNNDDDDDDDDDDENGNEKGEIIENIPPPNAADDDHDDEGTVELTASSDFHDFPDDKKRKVTSDEEKK